MALIKCPECGREISDKAIACPGCGAIVNKDNILSDDEQAKVLDTIVIEKKSPLVIPRLIVSISFLIISVILLVILLLLWGNIFQQISSSTTSVDFNVEPEIATILLVVASVLGIVYRKTIEEKKLCIIGMLYLVANMVINLGEDATFSFYNFLIILAGGINIAAFCMLKPEKIKKIICIAVSCALVAVSIVTTII